MALSERQQLFVEEYLKCWNATEAAKRAGYSAKTAYSQGSRLLKNAEVQAEIERRISEAAMSANEVLLRLAEHARGTLSDFFDIGDDGKPVLNLRKAEQAGKLHLLKKLKYDKDGNPEIELHDSQAALVHLGRHHKLFTEAVVTHDGEISIRHSVDSEQYQRALGTLAEALGAALPGGGAGGPGAVGAAEQPAVAGAAQPGR